MAVAKRSQSTSRPVLGTCRDHPDPSLLAKHILLIRRTTSTRESESCILYYVRDGKIVYMCESSVFVSVDAIDDTARLRLVDVA